MKQFKIIGLMSGTSLDGLDICYTSLTHEDQKGWNYKILFTETVSYSPEMFTALKNAITLSTLEHATLNIDFAKFSGKAINDFIENNNISKSEIDCIASHGHTTHHRPELGFTLQIGCGQTIAMLTNLNVICDFRTKDVVYGGQGAPLVPIGDELLFDTTIDGFLNIGGISNISFKNNGKRYAFDVCPGNLPLNFLVQKLELAYDDDGKRARSGQINQVLLQKLSALDFYQNQGKVSLGLEWISTEIFPLLDTSLPINDLLRTVVEHIAVQIGKVCNDEKINKLLVTGGGALNGFLVERIKANTTTTVMIPDKETILFKEALIFAFLGALQLANIPNCLPLVTGARKAVVAGVRFYP
jgi:anhydro-N-acetylmuramic acid kinase